MGYRLQGAVAISFEALTKEYIHGGSGLTAAIEPTTVNSNGTRTPRRSSGLPFVDSIENHCAIVRSPLEQNEAGRLVQQVAVGMSIAQHPPHRPVRALLTHTVLTLDIWRRSAQ